MCRTKTFPGVSFLSANTVTDATCTDGWLQRDLDFSDSGQEGLSSGFKANLRFEIQCIEVT